MNVKQFLITLVVVLVALAFLPLPVSAQDNLEGCSDEEITATLAEAADLLAQAQELSGVDALDALIDVKATLAAVEHCRGLDFEGEGKEVRDPIVFPDGLYRVTLNASSYVSIEGVVLSGACNEHYTEVGETFFLILGAKRGGTAQDVFTSDDCEVMWNIDNESPHTVTFEKLR